MEIVTISSCLGLVLFMFFKTVLKQFLTTCYSLKKIVIVI